MFVYGKTTFHCKDKDHPLTFLRLTGFVGSSAYLRFLDTRLSLGLSLFPMPLVLRYMVTFGLEFYQTYLLAFQVVSYFVESCLTT